jgi:hypothetical protein
MSKPLYQQLHDEAVDHELRVVFDEPSVQPQQVHEPVQEEPKTEAVGSFLQDFGHLRAMVQAREVHDPMSSSGRWEDLQLDLSSPHLPRLRRDPVRRHLKVTLPEGVTVPLIKLGPALGETLGLKAAGGANKYALTSIKTDKWEHNTHERAVASGERKFEADERRTFANFDAPAKTATQMLGRLVRAMRFGHPARREYLERQFRLLWSVRGQLRATLGVSPRKPVVKPKVVVTVAPKPLPPKPEYFDRLLAELGENAAKLGTLPRHDLLDDDQQALRTKLMARQRFIQSTIGRWL